MSSRVTFHSLFLLSVMSIDPVSLVYSFIGLVSGAGFFFKSAIPPPLAKFDWPIARLLYRGALGEIVIE